MPPKQSFSPQGVPEDDSYGWFLMIMGCVAMLIGCALIRCSVLAGRDSWGFAAFIAILAILEIIFGMYFVIHRDVRQVSNRPAGTGLVGHFLIATTVKRTGVCKSTHYAKAGVMGGVLDVKLIPIGYAASNEDRELFLDVFSLYVLDAFNVRQDHRIKLLCLLRKYGIANQESNRVGFTAGLLSGVRKVALVASCTDKWVRSDAYGKRRGWAEVFSGEIEMPSYQIIAAFNIFGGQFKDVFFTHPRPITSRQSIMSSIGSRFSGVRGFLVGTPDENRSDCVDNENEKANPFKAKGYPIYAIALFVTGYFGMLAAWLSIGLCRKWWTGGLCFLGMIFCFCVSVGSGLIVVDRIWGI